MQSHAGSGCHFHSNEGHRCTRGSDGDPRPGGPRKDLRCGGPVHEGRRRRYGVRYDCHGRDGEAVEDRKYSEVEVEEGKFVVPEAVLRHA